MFSAVSLAFCDQLQPNVLRK